MQRKYLPPLLLTVVLLAFYGITLAPGLTWANDGADGGDLVTAAARGGVAHPSGYPFYLLVARGFQLLPIGSLAFRTNLMSALCMTLAALLVYALVVGAHDGWSVRLAGAAAGLAFGLSPLAWSQAVITEVYALHALLVALILWLISLMERTPRRALDSLLGMVFGLALGNHVTTAILAPLLLGPPAPTRDASEARTRPNVGPRSEWLAALARRLAGLALGLTVYLILPLRALNQPPVNWGNPLTLDRLFWLVSGKMYQFQFQMTLPELVTRVQAAIALWLAQFGVAGLLLGVVGLVFYFSRSRLHWATLWTMLGVSAFAIVYGTFDSYVYLIPVFLCFAVWMGRGLAGLMDAAAARLRWGGLALGALVVVYVLALALQTLPHVDASHDARAEEFGEMVLAKLPPNALVFAKGDRSVFALWYYHFALGRRPNLVVIATDLMHFDWYQETLRYTYAGLNVPGPFPFPETLRMANPSRPACFVEFMMEFRCEPP